jgi:isopenicillin N synthase-like dioxygenase
VRSFKYYPTFEKDKTQIGNSLHTDWNLLTLVWTNRVGLQVLYDGEYIDYHDDQNEWSLICNFGDFLSSTSKGQIKSPWHRVIMNENERDSIVFFYYPKNSHPVVKEKIYN